jgi:hypothetical protein
MEEPSKGSGGVPRALVGVGVVMVGGCEETGAERSVRVE